MEKVIAVNGLEVKVSEAPAFDRVLRASWGSSSVWLSRVRISDYESDEAIATDILTRVKFLAEYIWLAPEFSREDFIALGGDSAEWDSADKKRKAYREEKKKAEAREKAEEKRFGVDRLGEFGGDNGWAVIWWGEDGVLMSNKREDAFERFPDIKDDILKDYEDSVKIVEGWGAEDREIILVSGICGNRGFIEGFGFESLEKAGHWFLSSSRICGDPYVIVNFREAGDYDVKKVSKKDRLTRLMEKKVLNGEEWGIVVTTVKAVLDVLRA